MISAVDPLPAILTTGYMRERSAPQYTDPYYLHLSDLRAALALLLTDVTGRWLDYGSNTSPYAEFFKDAILEYADIRQLPGLTYLITEEGLCPAGDAHFDGILSTQVLEHVDDVRCCLADCRRMLKPSGQLILTTHGIWFDHGCPGDYWRWTCDGLRLELERAGFVVQSCKKLTSGMRALIQLGILLERQFINHGRSTPIGMSLHLLGRFIGRYRARLNRFADRFSGLYSISEDADARMYIALVAAATKPA